MGFLKIISVLILFSVSLYAVDVHPLSNNIPGGLTKEETPMFVCFGWDDNAYADGVVWSDTLFRDKKNKDGSPARATYFITSGLASDYFREVGNQTPDSLKAAWKSLYDNGHEIANHTFSHPNGGTKMSGDGSPGLNYDKNQWQEEMQRCMDSLSTIMGITQDEILGFRTPYLSHNQSDFDAQKVMGIKYDCSIEYGYGSGWSDKNTELDTGSWNNSTADPATRAKLFWPFTLENGWASEDGKITNTYAPNIEAPGQWMFTVYTYLKPGGGEVTGFDGNMWTSGMLKDDFKNTLLYNFHLQRNGNKCPITINTHTDNYSEWSPGNEGQWKYKEEWQNRRLAIEEFLDSILQYDDVRVVPFKDVIEWINNPVAIGNTSNKMDIQNFGAALSGIKVVSGKMVEIDFSRSGNYSLDLYSVAGEKIKNLKSGHIPQGRYKMDLSNLIKGSGVYIVRLTGDATSTGRIVIK